MTNDGKYKPLTRDQLTDLVRYLDNQAEQLTGSDGVAASDILKHDAALRARVAELEQALRLHLAVAPDDPVLLTPIERQLAEMTAELASAIKVIDEREARIWELEAALRAMVLNVSQLEEMLRDVQQDLVNGNWPNLSTINGVFGSQSLTTKEEQP